MTLNFENNSCYYKWLLCNFYIEFLEHVQFWIFEEINLYLVLIILEFLSSILEYINYTKIMNYLSKNVDITSIIQY